MDIPTTKTNLPSDWRVQEFNGWKNFETWNVVLWLMNDFPLYCITTAFAKYTEPFKSLRQELKHSTFRYTKTDDGVSLWNRKLDIDAINEAIRQCASEDD